jgi:cytochrome P450
MASFPMPFFCREICLDLKKKAILEGVKEGFPNCSKISIYMHIFRPRPDLPVSQRPYRGFFSDTLEFLEGEMLETGSFYRVPFPWFPLTVTTDPEVVKQVLQSNHFNYVKSPAYRQLKLAVGKGLVTSEGEHWKRQRQLAQPAFYKSRLKGLYETMAQVAESYVNEWEVRLQKDPHADVSLEMMQLTAQIVLRALFSSEANLDLTRLYDLIVEAQDYVMFRTLQPLQIPLQYLNGRHRKFVKAKQSFDEVVFRLIEERRLQVDPPDDLLTMLVEAQLEGVGMTNEDLRDELLTLFFAGHETSANALAWTLYLLAHHPEVVSQLRSEIETVVGGDIPTWEDLPKLTYTRMVVEEGNATIPSRLRDRPTGDTGRCVEWGENSPGNRRFYRDLCHAPQPGTLGRPQCLSA